MAIRTKLYLAFAALVVLALFVGAEAMYAFTRTQKMVEATKQEVTYVSNHLVPINQHLSRMATDTMAAGWGFYSYIFSHFDVDYNDGMRYADASAKGMAEVEKVLAEAPKDRLGELRKDIPNIKSSLNQIIAMTNQIRSQIARLEETKQYISGLGDNVNKTLTALLEEAVGSIKSGFLAEMKPGMTEFPAILQRRIDRVNFIDKLGDEFANGELEFRIGNGYYQDQAEQYFLRAAAILKAAADESFSYANTPERVGRRQETKDAFLSFAKDLNDYVASIQSFSKEAKSTEKLGADMTDISDAMDVKIAELLKQNADSVVSLTAEIAANTVQIDALVDRAAFITTILVIASAVIGVISAFWITRSITHPINKIIDRLGNVETDISDASATLNNASQSLAGGVTEQASSLEETSAAMEEMASMARQTADNAKRGSELARQTSEAVNAGATAMDEMGQAMTNISESSDKVQNVIKTISDIAFQTNLLALNAAVEAARAGEAGKGFAVVADEVRNLSQRSAQAVRDTESLIQNTVDSVRHGNNIADKLAGSFTDIREGMTGIGQNIESIANAANEQAQGIDQVNNSVASMDRVTQQNASAASETAGASSNLENQVQGLQQDIGNLTRIVHGVVGAKLRAKRAAKATYANPTVLRPDLLEME